jgi:Recombination endonuclease VII
MRGRKIDISGGTKPCTKCGETKELSAFGTSKSSAGGYSVYCKECMAAAARARRATPEGKKAHYESTLRWIARQPQDKLVDGIKRCPKCQIEKPFAEYPKNKRSLHGINTYCLICSAEGVRARRATEEGQASHRAASKRWREANNERNKDNNARWRYGVAHGTYDEMLTAQGGKCAICKTTNPGVRLARFHIDHCHTTKEIRGLLCEHCNRGIGHFKDDPVILHRVINYLLPEGGREGGE